MRAATAAGAGAPASPAEPPAPAGSYRVRTVNGLSLPRIARARGATRIWTVALLGTTVAGCGVTGGRVDRGYPTSRPRVAVAGAMQPHLSGSTVHLTVPAGWGLARINAERGIPRAFVRLDGDCYLSVSITGSSSTALTGGQIAGLYAKPVAGYSWSVTRAGQTVLARLGQLSATTGTLSRSSLGTAYLPTSARANLAIDYGAGVWPLDGHACADSEVRTRLPALTAAITAIFASARLMPAAVAAGTGTAVAPILTTSTSVSVVASP